MKSNHSVFLLKIILFSEACVMLFGVWLMWRFIEVNHIRGDELLSFWHSSFFSPAQVFLNIRAGADNSYVHAVLLSLVFKIFGASIINQRLMSFFFWILGNVILFRLIRSRYRCAELTLLTLILVAFSNIGIFLATDGRFYSLLFFWGMLQLHLFVDLEKKASFSAKIFTVMVALCGLLTSMLYGVYLVLLVFVLFWAHKRKDTLVDKKTLHQTVWIFAGTGVVYFAVFSIDFFVKHFTNLYLQEQSLHLPDLDFFIMPLRWIMFPHIPFLSLTADAVIFVLWSIIPVAYAIKHKQTPLKFFRFVIYRMAMLIGTLFLIQILLQVCLGVPMWAVRYYAMLFCFIPLAFSLFADVNMFLKSPVVLLLLCIGLGLRMFQEYKKLPERELAQIKLRHIAAQLQGEQCIWIIERQEHASYELSVYGELYIRFPELRNRIGMLMDRGEFWNSYIQLLLNRGYPLNIVITSHIPVANDCVLLVHPEERRVLTGKKILYMQNLTPKKTY